MSNYRELREYCRKAYMRLHSVPGNARFLEYCVTRRVLIDQLVHAQILKDDEIFASYLKQTNPDERTLNHYISSNDYYLKDLLEKSSKIDSVPPVESLWAIDQIWLLVACRIKDTYRQLEAESCAEEINYRKLDTLIWSIEEHLKPYILKFFSALKCDTLNLRLLFPQLGRRTPRSRRKEPLMDWLTAPAERGDASARSLLQNALMTLGYDEENTEFTGMAQALRASRRVLSNDPDASLPVEPVELVPTAWLHWPESSTRIPELAETTCVASAHVAERYLRSRRPKQRLKKLDLDLKSLDGKDAMSAGELDAMMICLGLYLYDDLVTASTDHNQLSGTLEDWFCRLVWLTDSLSGEELEQCLR